MQLNEYEVNDYRYEAKYEIPVDATQKAENHRAEVLLHCLNSSRLKIKLITIYILFL